LSDIFRSELASTGGVPARSIAASDAANISELG
jgi:hypothetical protein